MPDAWNCLNLLLELDSSGFTLRSMAPEQSPMCDLLDLTIGNYKALPGRPHGEKLPFPYQTWCAANALQSAVMLHSRTYVALLSLWAGHAHTHTCIPNPNGCFQIPPYWGPWLRHCSTFAQYLSTTNPSFFLPPPGPQVHREAGAFCSGLLDHEMISTIGATSPEKFSKYVH